MSISFGKIRLRKEIDSVKITLVLMITISLVSCLVDFFNKFDFVASSIEVIFLIVFFRLFHRVIKELYYSYFTFAAVILFYFVNSLWISLSVTNNLFLFYLNLLGVTFLIIQVYILNSPIYFPIVNWWEYDFRFRDELKIKIKGEDKELNARLTDLRKKMGCIVLFEELPIGDVIKIELCNFESIGELTVEIISRRLYSVGRPYNYGVKFIFREEEDQNVYSHLARIWKTEHRSKLDLKYNK